MGNEPSSPSKMESGDYKELNKLMQNKRRIKNEGAEAMMLQLEDTSTKHIVYPAAIVHDFYIYDEIKGLGDHIELITALNTANDNEIVNIFLNTPGGDLMTTISIIHAMNRTNAQVWAHADGDVSSAGTLIFFSAENKVVNPYCTMLIHDASMGFGGGKFSESIKYMAAMNNLLDKIANDVYIPYFTQEEVSDILSGHDYYCDSDEIFRRLQVGEEIKEMERNKQDSKVTHKSTSKKKKNGKK